MSSPMAATSSVMSIPTGHQVMQRPQPTQPGAVELVHPGGELVGQPLPVAGPGGAAHLRGPACEWSTRSTTPTAGRAGHGAGEVRGVLDRHAEAGRAHERAAPQARHRSATSSHAGARGCRAAGGGPLGVESRVMRSRASCRTVARCSASAWRPAPCPPDGPAGPARRRSPPARGSGARLSSSVSTTSAPASTSGPRPWTCRSRSPPVSSTRPPRSWRPAAPTRRARPRRRRRGRPGPGSRWRRGRTTSGRGSHGAVRQRGVDHLDDPLRVEPGLPQRVTRGSSSRRGLDGPTGSEPAAAVVGEP